MHEVNYVYVIEPNEDIKTEDYEVVENDEGELKPLHFKWCPIDQIDKVDFRPQQLAKKFKNKDFAFEHIIIKE